MYWNQSPLSFSVQEQGNPIKSIVDVGALALVQARQQNMPTVILYQYNSVIVVI